MNFLKLISSPSGFVTTAASSAITGAVVYFGAPVYYPDLGGNINVPLLGSYPARPGLALYAGLGAYASEATAQYVLPLLPASSVTVGIERAIVGPAVTGGAMYGLMMFGSPNSASNFGPGLILFGAGANLIGNRVATAFQPSLKRLIG